MSDTQPTKIAIIGAGISGLCVAWNLRGDDRFKIDIYEKNHRIGGACHTGWVSIGGQYRFCDLGVNDFNTRAYTHVVKVMDEIGIPYGLLEDSACFYSGDQPLYSKDLWYRARAGKGGHPWEKQSVDYRAYTLGGLDYLPMPAALATEFARFKKEAPLDLVENAASFAEVTIGQYLTQKNYSPQFASTCILPRVNAMYFMTDDPGQTAADMPFSAVMHYYVLQEGFGTHFDGPLRMYFKDGSQNWIERLAQHLEANVLTGQDVQVDWSGDDGQWGVWDRAATGSPKALYDKVVFACHADQVVSAFRNWSGGPWNQIKPVLQKFRYAPSTAFAHTDASLLPPDPNTWRTYNVRVHEPQGGLVHHDYSMTYLINKHQNDGNSGRYDHFGGPQYFVSLNPAQIPAEDKILFDANTGAPMIAKFMHNVLNFDALAAQQALLKYQQDQAASPRSVLYTGGWCYGAGLHEECWIHGTAVAHALKTGTFALPKSSDAAGPAPHIAQVVMPSDGRPGS